MMKRFAAILVALCLMASFASCALAEEIFEIEPMLAPFIDVLASPETALTDDHATTVAGVMYLDYVMHLYESGKEIDTRGFGRDCVLGRLDQRVVASFDMGDAVMIMIYDTADHSCTVGIKSVASTPGLMMDSLKQTGITQLRVVDGTAWSTEVLNALQSVSE